jgi:hypothetical protein
MLNSAALALEYDLSGIDVKRRSTTETTATRAGNGRGTPAVTRWRCSVVPLMEAPAYR